MLNARNREEKMDDKILKAIRESDITELEKHNLQSVGYDGLVLDALNALSVRTLADLVTYSNKQRLIAVIDALPVEDKKAFYAICRKLNIRISEEMRVSPRKEKSAIDEKKKLINTEFLSKYITAQTNNYTIAWVKAIKGTEYNLSLSYLNTLFDKKPNLNEIRSLRCYYSAISLQSFSDYCLREFSDFGIDTQYKSLSLLLTYITVSYEISSEHEMDEFIVYQLFDERDDEPNFQGLFIIKKEQIEEDLLVRKNCFHFNNLINQEDNGKHRLNKNLYRIRSHIAMQKHYRYLLDRSGIRIDLVKNAEKTIQSLYQLRENTSTQFFAGTPETDWVVLKEIEESLGRKIIDQDDIDELDLSVRATNCLKRAGIRTIEQIQTSTEEDLRRVRNLGRRSLEEVLAVMYAHGFKIKDDPEYPTEYKFSENVADFNIRNCILDSNGRLIDFFAQYNVPTVDEIINAQDGAISSVLSAEDTIDKIDFSVRAFNCLRRRGIETIGDLIELTYDELIKTRNLGIRNIVEVIVTIYDKGFRLKDCSEEQYPSVEAYLLDKVTNCKERILNAFPDGILNIGVLQGRKLDFDNVKQSDKIIVDDSDELTKKKELLDAREAELAKRAEELAEKEDFLHRLEEKLSEITKQLQMDRAVHDSREKQLSIDIQTYDEKVVMLGKKQTEFEAWVTRTRQEIEEDQKANSLTRLVTSLEAIRAMVDVQISEERNALLEESRKALEKLQAEACAEIYRIQTDADARIKAKGVECDALTRAAEKKTADKVVELDKQIKDVNSLVSAMKKVIEDISSAISSRIATLQRTRSQMQSEMNALTGMFSSNQRKAIEGRIQQIDGEIYSLNSLQTIINAYKEAVKNEAMFRAMKNIELSFTPDKPTPKATAAKLFSFVETATTAAVEKFIGFSETDVVIPNTHNGKPVVAIASKAFTKCDSLKKIVFGNNMRKIGEYAFAECDNLECVEGTEHLTAIQSHAFYKCKKLWKFAFPACLEYIGSSAFCETAIDRFVLPPKMTEIEEFTFYRCPRLKSVIFHDKLTTIDGCAFADCASLQIVEIPKSVREITQSAFGGRISNNLRELRILTMNAEFRYGMVGNGFIAGKDLTVYCYPNSTAQTFFREHKVTVKPL